MDDEVRRFREYRQRASEAASDFVATNPQATGVSVNVAGVMVHRDRSGIERLVPYHPKGDKHE